MSTSEHGHGGEGASAESVAVGYEVSDWQVRPVITLAIATFVILALAYIVMGGLIFATGGELVDTSNAPSPTDVAQLPSGPLLERNPNADSERMIAEATAQLESYGWVDEGQGTAHMPIERAMELLVEKGVNPFPAAQPQGAAPRP